MLSVYRESPSPIPRHVLTVRVLHFPPYTLLTNQLDPSVYARNGVATASNEWTTSGDNVTRCDVRPCATIRGALGRLTHETDADRWFGLRTASSYGLARSGWPGLVGRFDISSFVQSHTASTAAAFSNVPLKSLQGVCTALSVVAVVVVVVVLLVVVVE